MVSKTHRCFLKKHLSLYFIEGNISRSDSAQLVLHQHVRHILAESGATETLQNNAPNSSGVFLLRLSGTRHGEIVLTYNFHDRAKPFAY